MGVILEFPKVWKPVLFICCKLDWPVNACISDGPWCWIWLGLKPPIAMLLAPWVPLVATSAKGINPVLNGCDAPAEAIIKGCCPDTTKVVCGSEETYAPLLDWWNICCRCCCTCCCWWWLCCLCCWWCCCCCWWWCCCWTCCCCEVLVCDTKSKFLTTCGVEDCWMETGNTLVVWGAALDWSTCTENIDKG